MKQSAEQRGKQICDKYLDLAMAKMCVGKTAASIPVVYRVLCFQHRETEYIHNDFRYVTNKSFSQIKLLIDETSDIHMVELIECTC